jgi:hypothetical protein
MAVLFFFSSCNENEPSTVGPQQTNVLAKQPQGNAVGSVYATGLNNPRGLRFGPDGYLYVAEGGTAGGNLSTIGQCDQVPGAGPYLGGFTSRISKISPDGIRTTVIDGLPSSETSAATGSLVSGVADIEFIDGQLFGLEGGAGCSHGHSADDNTIFRVNSNGTTTTVVDLSSYLAAHPTTNPDPSDFEADGTWYSMINVRDYLYAVEPNHQEIDRIDPVTGDVKKIVDLSILYPPSTGWYGPTKIAYHGDFFLGNLSEFPIVPGAASILKLTPSGQVNTWETGLTSILGLVFDSKDRMYVLESIGSGFPGPDAVNTGKIVRVLPSGEQQTIYEGLTFPTAMTMGPDGALYVSNNGFGIPVPGAGEIVKITLN